MLKEVDFGWRVLRHVLYSDIGRVPDHGIKSATRHFGREFGFPVEGIDSLVLRVGPGDRSPFRPTHQAIPAPDRCIELRQRGVSGPFNMLAQRLGSLALDELQ